MNNSAPCPKCNQTNQGQTGEYPCPECDLPTLWDDPTRLTLAEIVAQLELCEYKCEGGSLVWNVAFIELKRRAEGAKSESV